MENRKILVKKFAATATPLLFLIILLIISRVIPHIPNVAPIGAMSLFVGANLNWRYAVIIPLIAMYVSDYFIGFHTTMIFVYGSFLVISILGISLKYKKTPIIIFGASLVSSILFFVITNFGVWIAGDIYPPTLDGLISCFVAALPFFRNTLLGDLAYNGIFFGGYAIIQRINLKNLLHKTG